MIRLENFLRVSLQGVLKMPWRRLQNVLKASWRCLEDALKTSCRNVFNASSRCLQDVLKTPSRCLQDVLKTSWRRIAKTNILVLSKTSWRRLEDVFWRRMTKVNMFVLKTYSEDEDDRRLQDVQKQPPKVFLEILQNSQENNCARDFFLIKFQVY